MKSLYPLVNVSIAIENCPSSSLIYLYQSGDFPWFFWCFLCVFLKVTPFKSKEHVACRWFVEAVAVEHRAVAALFDTWNCCRMSAIFPTEPIQNGADKTPEIGERRCVNEELKWPIDPCGCDSAMIGQSNPVFNEQIDGFWVLGYSLTDPSFAGEKRRNLRGFQYIQVQHTCMHTHTQNVTMQPNKVWSWSRVGHFEQVQQENRWFQGTPVVGNLVVLGSKPCFLWFIFIHPVVGTLVGKERWVDWSPPIRVQPGSWSLVAHKKDLLLFMVCLWFVYGLFMVCLWFVYGLFMVSSHFSKNKVKDWTTMNHPSKIGAVLSFFFRVSVLGTQRNSSCSWQVARVGTLSSDHRCLEIAASDAGSGCCKLLYSKKNNTMWVSSSYKLVY